MKDKPKKRFRLKWSKEKVISGGRFKKPRKKTLMPILYREKKRVVE
ncbi:MAG: hypothetical protein ACTSPI_03535 [Candidatus Heimdallarchaeaceae archaeon]